MKHSSQQLELIFNHSFAEIWRTCLRGGADEPLYLPAKNENELHSIIYTQDYFASALHEVAHWCIAGIAKRQITDYGYWYIKGPRSSSQQERFLQVEQYPQALEWIFSTACQFPFHLSYDNLESTEKDEHFSRHVQMKAVYLVEKGLPSRAALFASELAVQFGGDKYLDPVSYAQPFFSFSGH